MIFPAGRYDLGVQNIAGKFCRLYTDLNTLAGLPVVQEANTQKLEL